MLSSVVIYFEYFWWRIKGTSKLNLNFCTFRNDVSLSTEPI